LSRWLEGRPLLVLVFLLTLPLVTPRVRGADEIEYFSYLPSIVFDRDLDFADEYQWFYERDPRGLEGFRATFLERHEPLTGRSINFAPLGSALLWSPFYLIAHAGVRVAGALGAGGTADGLSLPYQAAVSLGSALYALLGLLLTHDMLRRHAGLPEPAASWAPAALWLGTPLLYYTTLAPAFSHACSLFAVSLLLWRWLRARAGESWIAWALVGLAGGLCALVREQDLLFLAVPAADLAWSTARRRDARTAVVRGAAMAAGAALAFLPQLFAYRAINGSWGPSTLVRRKMDYLSPHFVGVLLDPAHGLFPWAPLLLLAAAGLLFGLSRRDARWTLMLVAFLLQAWINGAVESWTQAGAFGSRRFIAATPAFAWGLGLVLASARPRVGNALLAAGLAVFAWWNASLMVQFGLRLMDRQRLRWPEVAVNQVRAVPPRMGRAAWLFFTDRERLAREGP
jgi:hypothetical protein